MEIVCPNCNFSKTVDPAKVPDRPVKVNCPKCSQSFTFDKSLLPVSATGTKMEDSKAGQINSPEVEQINCPACGLTQDKSDRCSDCGVIYEKVQVQRQEYGSVDNETETLNGNLAELRKKAANPAPQLQPKAGFWIRVVASLLDSFLLGAVQFVLSLLIGLAISMLGIAAAGDPSINMVLWLFGVSLGIGYAVFFTGYCGQTPGKMALRIKVIRTDGSPMTYGRAALREVLGKFISGILLCIGYIMVAFDSQKQGLHDKIADTYVIKL
jgi:predicted Zn finger-like uncharacterized protein